jgi:predicted Zn-dependent protease
MEALQHENDSADADALTHYLYAARLVDAGKTPGALKPIGQALQELTPNDSDDLIGRTSSLAACIAAQTGAVMQAQDSLKHADMVHVHDVFYYWAQGVIAVHNNDLAGAAEALTQAADADPSQEKVWLGLGQAYSFGQMPDHALGAFRHAVALAPTDADAHAGLSQALAGLHRYEEAGREEDEAVRLAPGNPEIAMVPIVGRAVAARTEAEYHDAATHLAAFMASHPTNPVLNAADAGLHLRFGDMREACRQLQACVALDPSKPAYLHNLAMVQDWLGDRSGSQQTDARCQRVVDDLSEIVALSNHLTVQGDDVPALNRVAGLFERSGHPAEASQARARAAALSAGGAR